MSDHEPSHDDGEFPPPLADLGDDDAYFETNPAPPTLPATLDSVREFISRHNVPASPRPGVVLITSGGTTVPLENQTVRFIDNFSAGTRGATSAEYFLAEGYAVVFLHRQFSLLPFSRHYSHSTNCFLDYMDEEDDDASDGGPASNGTAGGRRDRARGDGGGRVVVAQRYQSSMRAVLRRYRASKRDGTLLLLPFTTITEYLWTLREVARAMAPLGSRAIFYLAAAVSDFFVPKDRMVEHKIQSGEEFNEQLERQQTNGSTASASAAPPPPAAHMDGQRLVIDLEPVPKFLKRLVDGWAPEGMIVSFKLETDPSILAAKAHHSLKKYAHHLVIGNLLATRKWEVVFVSALEGEQWIRVPRRRRLQSISGQASLVGWAQRAALRAEREDDLNGSAVEEQEGEPMIEIESLIVPQVKRLHVDFKHRIDKGESVTA